MIDNNIHRKVEEYSAPFDSSFKETAIILAAGHGKRIKSHRSKMLHNIWGVPTVERVYSAIKNGIPEANIIVVVGIKAEDVIEVIGKRENTLFAYQEEQRGTGHAVQNALGKINDKNYDGVIYIFPGDMGLINSETVSLMREKFICGNLLNKKNTSYKFCSDMLVLTGIYEGPIDKNNYGRIIRVKEKDTNENSAENDCGNVIEIIEYKDILTLEDDKPYLVDYHNKTYSYTKEELLNNREFNSGVYAINYCKLVEQLKNIRSDNAQNEIYITDLISLFNKKGYTVSAINPTENNVVIGFNEKSVLKEMENIYRHKIYNKIKDIIEIDDPEDFFIDEDLVDNIIELDKKNIPLDIKIGKGVHIGKGVKLNYNLELKKNVFVSGNVIFGKNVVVWENVHLSCFSNQKFIIGDNVEILWGDIIKGNIVIGDNSRIESSVNMTGSDDFPLRIGKNVLIKGTSYIFGSIIEDDIFIEHSVLIKKKVQRLVKRNGEVQPIRFYLPMPQGLDAVEDL